MRAERVMHFPILPRKAWRKCGEDSGDRGFSNRWFDETQHLSWRKPGFFRAFYVMADGEHGSGNLAT